jgi:AP-1-like transcription factor
VEELDLDYTSVNISEIMLKLKGHEKCHGFGPAYPLDLVDSVISKCLQE